MRHAILASFLLVRGAAQSSFQITTVAGVNPSGDGLSAASVALSTVEGLATDIAGNMYLADNGERRVRRVDRQGRIATVGSDLGSPYGIAVDGGGCFGVFRGHVISRRLAKRAGCAAKYPPS